VAPLLSVEHVTRTFGGLVALDDVSLAVERGQIAGLIGPNGAGKTTLFNVVTRLYKPDSGNVVFDGQELLRMRAHAIVGLGIARTFQNVALFPSMTALENVLVGAHARAELSEESTARAAALEALDYLGDAKLAERPVAGLPFATLKRIEIARALVSRPRLVLLDEPAGGLNHEEVEELASLIRRIRDDYDLTILLVEHHMNLVMSVSDHVHVLNFGQKIAEGTPNEVRNNQDVIEAYLGTADADRRTAPKPESVAAATSKEAAPLLELRDVEARYGPIVALQGVSLSVHEGEVVALLGANGAGKTTTLRAVSGTVRKSGHVLYAGTDVSRAPPERLAKLGVAHLPEGRGILTELTVWENLRMGAYLRRDRQVRADLERVAALFPWMQERRGQEAGTLSGGEQQMLALARALVSRPKLLMLDEPSLGLAPLVVQELFRVVTELNEAEGLTVLVVEQNANIALDVSRRAYVLEVGRVAVEGSSEELRQHEGVRRSYLGY